MFMHKNIEEMSDLELLDEFDKALDRFDLVAGTRSEDELKEYIRVLCEEVSRREGVWECYLMK